MCRAAPLVCEEGHYTTVNADNNRIACVQCPGGYVCSGEALCAAAAAARTRVPTMPIALTFTPMHGAVGHAVTVPGGAKVACPAGRFSATGRTTCTLCTGGFYCPTTATPADGQVACGSIEVRAAVAGGVWLPLEQRHSQALRLVPTSTYLPQWACGDSPTARPAVQWHWMCQLGTSQQMGRPQTASGSCRAVPATTVKRVPGVACRAV